jgi:amino acid permease
MHGLWYEFECCFDQQHLMFGVQALTFLLYMLSATLGYLADPTTTAGSLLDMYPDSAGIDALRILMAISVILSFPIILFPTRENVDKLMFSGLKSCFAHRPLSNSRFYIQNIILCWIAYCITVAIPSFRTILNLWGSFTGTFLAYIFPPVFYLKSSSVQFKADKKAWGALFLLVVGGLSGFVSLGLTLQHCFFASHNCFAD